MASSTKARFVTGAAWLCSSGRVTGSPWPPPTLGFRRSHIYYLFLSKAILLALAGGALGYVVGTATAMVLGRELAGLQVPAVPVLLLWSLLVATGSSILGFWYPIHCAARIDPAIIMQEL